LAEKKTAQGLGGGWSYSENVLDGVFLGVSGRHEIDASFFQKLQLAESEGGVIVEVGGNVSSDIIASHVAVILGKGETFTGVGSAAEDATSDGPGKIDGGISSSGAGTFEHVDSLRDIAEALAFVERKIDGDSEERMRRGAITHKGDVGHFGNAFVELLIIRFGKQIDERFEWRAAEDSAQERAGVFGAANVTFDFVSDQGSHRTCVYDAPVGDDETRLAVFGFVAGINGLNLRVENALPSRAEPVVVQNSVEGIANFGCLEATLFELGLFGFAETRLVAAVVGCGVFECMVAAHGEAGTGATVGSDDSALCAQIFFLQDTGGDFGSQHGVAGAMLQELENYAVDLVLADTVIANLLPVAVDVIAEKGNAFQFFEIVPKIGVGEVTGASASFPVFLDIGQVGRVTDSDGIHRHCGE